jgi:hypothetical protein
MRVIYQNDIVRSIAFCGDTGTVQSRPVRISLRGPPFPPLVPASKKSRHMFFPCVRVSLVMMTMTTVVVQGGLPITQNTPLPCFIDLVIWPGGQVGHRSR